MKKGRIYWVYPIRRGVVLNRLFTLSSFANVLGGAVLFFTWAANRMSDPARHVPLVVLVIGASMIIQGLYSAGYSLAWWSSWPDVSSGALLAGQLISLCAGAGLLIAGFTTMPRSSHGDFEPAPILAGLMITVNALLALTILASSGALTPKPRARGPA